MITAEAPQIDAMMRLSSRSSACLEMLGAALSRAQAKIKHAAKDANNPHFNSQYADLASVWEACREPLTSEGLSIVQMPCGSGDVVGLTTTLLHASGQFMSSTIYTTPERKGPQAVGSVLTYLRRYALAAAVGVAPDDDDDGNAAEPAAAPANDNGRRYSARPSVRSGERYVQPATDAEHREARLIADLPAPRDSARRQSDPPPAGAGEPVPSSPGSPSPAKLRKYHALRVKMGISEDEGRARVSNVLGRKVESITDVNSAEMDRVLDKMEAAV